MSRSSKDFGGFLSGGLAMSWSRSTPDTGPATTPISRLQAPKTRADMRQPERKMDQFRSGGRLQHIDKTGTFSGRQLGEASQAYDGGSIPLTRSKQNQWLSGEFRTEISPSAPICADPAPLAPRISLTKSSLAHCKRLDQEGWFAPSTGAAGGRCQPRFRASTGISRAPLAIPLSGTYQEQFCWSNATAQVRAGLRPPTLPLALWAAMAVLDARERRRTLTASISVS